MNRDPPNLNPYAPPVAVDPVAQRAIGQLSAGSAHEAPLAARSTRFWAALVDDLFYFLLALPGFVAFMGSDQMDSLRNDLNTVTRLFYAYCLPLPLLFACFQWYLVAKTGQSLAKRWFRIRIVRLDGSLPGFVHGVFLRSWLLQLFSMACGLVALVDAVMIFADDRRCLHDHFADTMVVEL